MKKVQAVILLFLTFTSSFGIGMVGSWIFSQKEDGNIEPYYAQTSPIKEGKNSSTPIQSGDNDSFKREEPIAQKTTTIVKEVEENKDAIEPGEQLDAIKEVGIKIDFSKEIKLVTLDGPNPDPEKRTYSLTAIAEGGIRELTYLLYPLKNAKDTLVSNSGNFTDINPCSNGKYILLVKDAYGNELKKEVSGFINILRKLTPQEVTTRLSKATPDQSLKYYFPQGKYSIKFEGLKSGDPVPTTYTQIYSNIASGYWSKVKVTNIEYNDYNKITRIYINVY